MLLVGIRVAVVRVIENKAAVLLQFGEVGARSVSARIVIVTAGLTLERVVVHRLVRPRADGGRRNGPEPSARAIAEELRRVRVGLDRVETERVGAVCARSRAV